jgi:phosphatidylcholine synthase
MASRSTPARATRPAPPLRRIAAFSVHLFTALGAAVALLALLAAIAGEFTVMFALLGIALAIDGVDGMLARRFKVAEILPRWSGDILDYVVDFLTYVFVPALALATSAILPQPLALPAAVAVVVSGALYFADTRMKTADGYFRGFPALWNLVAFYLFVIHPDPAIAAAIVAVFVVLTFVPMLVAHPLRARGWPRLNLILLIVWGALALATLAYHLSPPLPVKLGLILAAAYFLLAGFARPPTKKS